MIPGNTGIPESCQKTASATKESSWHKVWGVCQTQALSTCNIAKDTLFIDLTLRKNGNSGENVSTCVPFQRYCWWTWTGLLHECPSVRSVSMAKVQCSPTWFQVATGFLEALSQLHQQLRLIPTQGLRFLPDSSFLPFIDLIFGKIKAQSCEEISSLTAVTGWHLHVCPFFSTGDWYELHCCTNAPSIGKTGKTLN